MAAIKCKNKAGHLMYVIKKVTRDLFLRKMHGERYNIMRQELQVFYGVFLEKCHMCNETR